MLACRCPSCILALNVLVLLVSFVTASTILVSKQTDMQVVYWRCFATKNCCLDIHRALETEAIAAVDFDLQACYQNIASVPENPNLGDRVPSHLYMTTGKNHTNSWWPPPDEEFSKIDWISYLWNSTNWMHARSNSKEPSPRVLKSWWSGDRGMHKVIYQRVLLNEARSASLLFYLPRSMFMNVEDVFHPDSKGFKLIHNGVIDEEQPSFASPAHAVWIDISNSKDAVVEYGLKVHTRYPEPDGEFQKVTIIAPTAVSESDENANESFELLSTWVASGARDDLGIVLFGSICAAIIGAVVMLKDMTRVAKWE